MGCLSRSRAGVKQHLKDSDDLGTPCHEMSSNPLLLMQSFGFFTYLRERDRSQTIASRGIHLRSLEGKEKPEKEEWPSAETLGHVYEFKHSEFGELNDVSKPKKTFDQRVSPHPITKKAAIFPKWEWIYRLWGWNGRTQRFNRRLCEWSPPRGGDSSLSGTLIPK